MRPFELLRWLLLLPCLVSAFLQPRRSFAVPARMMERSVLRMVDISVTTPSSDAAAEMGIPEWSQQLKEGSWEETSSEGQTLVRYVLDGNGVLEIDTADHKYPKRTTNLTPGTLVEVSGDASLSWSAEGEMIILTEIILTPGFEEGNKSLAYAVAAILIFGALLAGVGF
jgi:hypothetical protein